MYVVAETSALYNRKESGLASGPMVMRPYSCPRSVSTRRRFVPMSLIPSRDEERT